MSAIGMIKTTAAVFVVAICVAGWCQSPDEVAQIEQAIPAKATVEPKKPRRILLLSQTLGFKHDSIPCGEKAFEALGRKTGAFTVVVTHDATSFTKETLADFDAVLFNNTTGELMTTPSVQRAFMDFVQSGKGFIGIHAATDTCYSWPEYGRMIGGYFNGHPWTAESTVTLKLDDPGHPIAAAFGSEPLTVVDEIYQFKAPYSRANLHVLASLDPARTDMTRQGINRPDGDFPVSWIKTHGSGRVFYCSLGHNKHIYWNATVLRHYLDGIQYALGDLEADASPQKAMAEQLVTGAFERELAAISNLGFEHSNDFSGTAATLLRQGDSLPAAREKMVGMLARLATDSQASMTQAGRLFAFHRLAEYASENDAKLLAPGLTSTDPQIADLARGVIEQIPGKHVDALLREAVGTAPESSRAAILNALGARHDQDALLELKAGAAAENTTISLAAIGALGRIGTAEADGVLRKLAGNSKGDLRNAALRARVACADNLLAMQQVQVAKAIYEEVSKSDASASIRAAAFRSMLKSDPKSDTRAIAAFLGEDRALRQIAASELLLMKDSAVTTEIIGRLPKLPAKQQVVAINLLVARGDKSALPAIKNVVRENTTDSLRIAVIRAIGRLGNATEVPALLKMASTSKGGRRDAARDALANLSSRDVTPALLAALEHENDPVANSKQAKIELITALGRRRAASAVPVLLDLATGTDEKIAAEAMKAAADLLRVGDLPKLFALLPRVKSEGALSETEQALLGVIRQVEPAKDQSRVVLDQLASAPSIEVKALLVRVLGKFTDTAALEALSKLQGATEPAVQEAAVRALIDFPTAAPIDDVLQVARTSNNDVQKVLAVRGFIRMLGLSSDRATSETLQYIDEATKLAQTAEDRRALIGTLSEMNQPGILQKAAVYLDNAELKSEANAAVLKLAENGYGYAPAEAREALAKIVANSSDDKEKAKASEILKRIDETSTSILAWAMAGPFSKEKVGTSEALLKQKFDPEQTDKTDQVKWKFISAGSDKKHPESLDLDKIVGGKKQVVYLRAYVWSPDERDAKLLTGSDDGLKAWLNGQQVILAAGTRPYEADKDNAQVHLKSGWNALVLKVSQESGMWAAAARFTTLDGAPMKDLRTEVTGHSDQPGIPVKG